jgi:hypothetical protein
MPDYRQSQISLKHLMLPVTTIAIGCGAVAFATRSLDQAGVKLLISRLMIGVGAGLIGLGVNILLKNSWFGVVGFVVMMAVIFLASRAMG